MAKTKVIRNKRPPTGGPRRTRRTDAQAKTAAAKHKAGDHPKFSAPTQTPDDLLPVNVHTFRDCALLVDKLREEGSTLMPPAPVVLGEPWRDAQINPDASLLTLALASIEDFEGDPRRGLTPIGLLERAVRAAADDVGLIESTLGNDALDHSDVIARVLHRIENRSRLFLEIATRLQAGGAS